MEKAAVASVKDWLVVRCCCIPGLGHQEEVGFPAVLPPRVLVRVAQGWCPAAGLVQVALEWPIAMR